MSRITTSTPTTSAVPTLRGRYRLTRFKIDNLRFERVQPVGADFHGAVCRTTGEALFCLDYCGTDPAKLRQMARLLERLADMVTPAQG